MDLLPVKSCVGWGPEAWHVRVCVQLPWTSSFTVSILSTILPLSCHLIIMVIYFSVWPIGDHKAIQEYQARRLGSL